MRKKIQKNHGNKKFLSLFFKIGYLLFIVFLLVDLYLIYSLKIFNIKKITIMGEVNCASINSVREGVDLQGKNLIFTDENFLEKKIKNKFFCIKSLQLNKKYPDQIFLKLQERTSEIELAIQDSNATPSADFEPEATSSAVLNYFLVDSEGVLYSEIKDKVNLPIIFFHGDSENLSLGKSINGELIKILKIFEDIKKIGLSIKEVRIYSKETAVVDSLDEKRIIFSLTRDISNQLASLQLILIQAKIDEREIKIIDLRFEKPVVKYVKTEKK